MVMSRSFTKVNYVGGRSRGITPVHCLGELSREIMLVRIVLCSSLLFVVGVCCCVV